MSWHIPIERSNWVWWGSSWFSDARPIMHLNSIPRHSLAALLTAQKPSFPFLSTFSTPRCEWRWNYAFFMRQWMQVRSLLLLSLRQPSSVNNHSFSWLGCLFLEQQTSSLDNYITRLGEISTFSAGCHAWIATLDLLLCAFCKNSILHSCTHSCCWLCFNFHLLQ